MTGRKNCKTSAFVTIIYYGEEQNIIKRFKEAILGIAKRLATISYMTILITVGLGFLLGDTIHNRASGKDSDRTINSKGQSSGGNKDLAFDPSDEKSRLEYLRSIPVTRWPEIDGGQPVTYEEWKAKAGEPAPFQMSLAKRSSLYKGKGDSIPFCVIVNDLLYSEIESSIDQYVADLALEDYDVEVYTTSGGTPDDLRAFLQERYANGLEGCVLIGDLPIPWFETDCWDPPEYCSFPIDLFYMDLDGLWLDMDSNGIYDSHAAGAGDLTPEIWVGRLTASTMTLEGADEASLIQNYFYKNHKYRTGQDFLNNRALVYIDDDWVPWVSEWSGDVGLAYAERSLVWEEWRTRDYDYEDSLEQNFESLLLCAHSSPDCHYFKVYDQWTGGTTCNLDVKSIDPKAYFYNLFACSNARYVESDYMAGWYIFCQSYGLASIGSTKTGSMLYFNYFYQPFGDGKTIGQAFFDWFFTIGSWGFPQDDLCWFYGMTLCGDPTLKHAEPDPVNITTITLIDGLYGEEYCDTIEATGGIPPYNWEIVAGVPPGLSLDSLTGIISGVPSSIGALDFTVQAADAGIPSLSGTELLNIFVTFVCGDANNDQAVNLLDISYLVAYLYHGGQEPQPPEAADVNGSGNADILDITYLITYLYRGGPAPACE